MPLDIAIVPAEPQDVLSGNAAALLQEISTLLSRLLENGETGSLDLKSLPLTATDRFWLSEQLGEGEVEITLEVAGPSTIRETALPGVWWITHRGQGGKVLSEFIEVTRMPDIVLPAVEDIRDGLKRLCGRISEIAETNG